MGAESGEGARLAPGIKGFFLYTILRGLDFLFFTLTAGLQTLTNAESNINVPLKGNGKVNYDSHWMKFCETIKMFVFSKLNSIYLRFYC